MDWEQRLTENTAGLGDPVTALWQPTGFVVAQSFPLAPAAVAWIARLGLGERAARPFVAELTTADTASELIRIRERLIVLRTGVRSRRRWDLGISATELVGPDTAFDALTLRAYLGASEVSVTIRPHDAARDGAEDGPPLVGIEWRNLRTLPRGLGLAETFGPLVHNECCAWTDTSATGLTSVAMTFSRPLAVDTDTPWSLLDVRWPRRKGGIAVHRTSDSALHLATLPKALAPVLVRASGDADRTGSAVRFGGGRFYLNGLRPTRPFQTL